MDHRVLLHHRTTVVLTTAMTAAALPAEGVTHRQWSMSSDPSSRKSDDITGPTCPAPSLYDSNTDDDNDDGDDDDCGSDGGDTSPQWTISSDHAS